MRFALIVGWLLVVLSPRPARAESLVQRIERFVMDTLSGIGEHSSTRPPRFAFTPGAFVVSPASVDDAIDGSIDSVAFDRKKVSTVALAIDGKTAWLAGDLGHYIVCGAGDCDNRKPSGYYHATVLVEVPSLTPIAWHLAVPISYKDQRAALARGPSLPALPRTIDAGAEEVVKVFETTFADPKALAGSLSGRKDVVVYGSEKSERYVGSRAAKKTLATWNLAFRAKGGIQAGLAPSGTVAWVAAHVAATSVKAPNQAVSVPYRVLAIYEKSGRDWKLVSANFSFVP